MNLPQNTKISIIIPTYNSSLFIERTMASVLKQTFNNWELIIVDDCSNDNTYSILKKFEGIDKRIKVFKTLKNSGGPTVPKNIGFKKTTGEYIAYLDHDDEWLPEKLEKQIMVFENTKDPKLGLVSCGANLINTKNKIFSIYKPIIKKKYLPEILLRNPIYSNSSVLIKKEVIDAIGPRDENMKYSEDWEMWIRIIINGYNINFINQPLFNYYFHNNNVTKTLKDKLVKVRDAEYVFKKYYNTYSKYNYLHIGYFRLGVMYLLGGDIKTSRLNFMRSIKLKNFFIPAYIGYLLSFLNILGILVINFLIFLYRILKGKIYLLKTTNS